MRKANDGWRWQNDGHGTMRIDYVQSIIYLYDEFVFDLIFKQKCLLGCRLSYHDVVKLSCYEGGPAGQSQHSTIMYVWMD